MSERTDLVLDETATQLDRILNALCPPAYDPLKDPEETVFVMRDGSKKVLTDVKTRWDIDPEAENSGELLLYFDGSKTPMDSSSYGDVIGLKFGNYKNKTYQCYPYNCSGASIMAPAEYAGNSSTTAYPNLEWITFEDLSPDFYPGPPSALITHTDEEIIMNDLTHLTSITFPTSADCSICIANDSNLKVINHPNGQIFGRNSYIDGCSLSTINFPSSGYVKTDFDTEYGTSLPDTILSVTIPTNLSFDFANYTFAKQKDIYFEGRTVAEVKALSSYPSEDSYYDSMFGCVSESPSKYGSPDPVMTLHCSDGNISLYEYVS